MDISTYVKISYKSLRKRKVKDQTKQGLQNQVPTGIRQVIGRDQ